MANNNIIAKLLRRVFPKPTEIDAPTVQQSYHLTDEDKKLIRKIGVSTGMLAKTIRDNTYVNFDRYNLYKELDRACLVGSTRIRLLDGTNPTIKEMAEAPEKYVGKSTYSINPETMDIEPDKIAACMQTRKNAELVRVHLDSGEYVDCTPDHEFMLRDGSFKEAQDLAEGQSLMPLYTKVCKKGLVGYELVYRPKTDGYSFTHAHVFKMAFGGKKGRGTVIHRTTEYSKKASANTKSAWESEAYRSNRSSNYQRHNPYPKHRKSRKEELVLVNHKVTKIESLEHREDTYDITTAKNHNFPVSGVFVHNCSHWAMGAAAELYGDVATVYNKEHNATVWIQSDDSRYRDVLTDLLNRIGLEERIFDWAWTTGTYGDLFVNVVGRDGVGIASVEDTEHPIAISRVDLNGRLVGFYDTPLTASYAEKENMLIAPWEYVHFRLLGAKMKRPIYSDPMMAEFRTINLMGQDKRRPSTKYGTSLLTNALPTYKRLRLTEDSLLLARLSKGVLHYLYKVQVDGCLAGDTKIRLLDGTSPSIKEMAEAPEKYIGKSIWTVNEKTTALEVNRIKGAIATRKNAQLVRVHLDNEKYVDCTPDHLFMLRDGSYKEAQTLVPQESLMPHYERLGEKGGLAGYNLVLDPKDNKYHYEHKMVADQVLGETPRGSLRHHKTLDKLNNDPKELEIMPRDVHAVLHKKIGDSPLTEEAKRKIGKKAKARYEAGAMPWNKGLGLNTHTMEFPKYEERTCTCGCGRKFLAGVNEVKRYSMGHMASEARKKANDAAAEWHKGKEPWNKHLVEDGVLVNHKVVRVEWLKERQDTYDLCIENTPNFPIASGIFVHNSNLEAVSEILDEYDTVLKRARALNTSDNARFEDKADTMNVLEDVILPVWGDVNNLKVEKIGGEVDIRWITDIEELRNQLSSALRVPLALLGGFVGELPGGLGESSLSQLNIRFARSARRLQRALIDGITRICQIDLAYRGMDPDPKLFQVEMSETSTKEEEELKSALDTGVDTVDKLVELILKYNPDVDKTELFNYMNQKILKLNDLDLNRFKAGVSPESRERLAKEIAKGAKIESYNANTDLKSFLPVSDSVKWHTTQKLWEKNWKGKKVIEKAASGKKGR